MDTFEQAKTHFLAGLAYLQQDRLAEAEVELKQSLALLPDRPSTLINLSACLIKQEKIEASRSLAQRALEIDPKAAEAWLNQGLIDNHDEHYDDALAHFDRALTLQPDNPDAWSNRGLALQELLRYEAAIESCDRAIAIAPQHALAWANRGVACETLQRDQEARDCFLKALQHEPDNLQARWSLCKLLFKLQEYQASWELFEARWDIIKPTPPKLQSRRPLWDGQPGETPILLWGEQGIGDQILYASILPELVNLPQRKMLALDRRLIPLFERSMPGFELLDLETVSDALPFAQQLPLGSLPGYFRPSFQSFANARHPYLVADATRSTALRAQITRPGRRVCGVAWNSLRKYIGPGKSVSLSQMLAPLAELPLHFVDLQYGDTTEEREALRHSHGVHVQNLSEIDNFHDLDGLAALINACDVVLTTSNSTAHLAGALGKKTLLLLPLGKGRLWYWVEHQGSNPWYPSVTQFSQIQHADWLEPLAQVRQHLQENYAT